MSAARTPEGSRAPGSPRRRAALGIVLVVALAGGGALLRSRAGARSPAPAPASGAPVGSALAPGCSEDMVALPAGSFQMGSPEGEGSDDERPRHAVVLQGYCLDRREVSVAAYRACVEQPRGGLSCKPAGTRLYCNGGRRDRDDHPVNCVDWNDANAFCAWAGKRLPTEAEWEYAARAGSEQRLFPWGSEAPSGQLCWDGEGNERGKGNREGTCAAGSFAGRGGSGRGGIEDLAGNVAEWVADSYAVYQAGEARDPLVKDRPLQVGKRVIRGGAWFSDEPGQVRAARRDWFVASDRVFDVGFRCARGGG